MLAGCTQLAGISRGHVAARIVMASADDCAIVVAIGKSELKWGENPPAAALLPDFPLPDGAIYREDCAWKQLGVAAPAIGNEQSRIAFFITRPDYSGSRATAFFHYSVASVRLPDGAVLPPFLERERCSLEKKPGGWHLVSCKLIGIAP